MRFEFRKIFIVSLPGGFPGSFREVTIWVIMQDFEENFLSFGIFEERLNIIKIYAVMLTNS